MQKTCIQCQSAFVVTDEDLAFLKNMSPTFGGVQYDIPAPQMCPDCREQRRLLFRNLRKLYRRPCDLTGESILTGYSPEGPMTVYKKEEWWGDSWDALSYGKEYDFQKPFFEQFAELYHSVPMLQLFLTLCENCDYVNGAGKCKNCYICFNIDYCEESLYLADAMHIRYCVDCLSINNCELCYACVECDNCYHTFYSERSSNCNDGYFLHDCRRCTNCSGCCNLVDKEYYIFNEPHTKEDYEAAAQQLLAPSALQDTEQRARELALTLPKKYYFGHSNEYFSGENIIHAKNSYYCFDVNEAENCRYCHYNGNIHDCMDHTIYGDNSEWIYNCLATGTNCSNNAFCFFCWDGSSNNFYCHLINATKDCFGSCCLKSQRYCILNKQYTENEYNDLVPKIIEHMRSTGEWGEFFPKHLSPYGYNETVAQEYFPLTKEEALQQGYTWRDETDEPLTVSKVIPGDRLPDAIADVPDDVLNWAIECMESGRPFKITAQELDFYRQNNIPVPRLHPDVRHFKRIDRRNPRHLWERKCAKCQKVIQTSYSPERPEIVYCEECYLAEVY